MNTSILIYNSSDGKSKISAQIFTPDEGIQPRAVLQIAHGMCEYIGRYEQMAEYFCDRGFVVCGNDHLGHRDTALLNREKLGYFGPKGSWKYLVEDLELLRLEMAGQYPGLPYFLFGHSMGSFISRVYVDRFGSSLSGVIFSGTAGKNPAIGAGKALAAASEALHGPKHVSKSLFMLTTGSYARAIEGAKTPVDWLCHDADVCCKYIHDPYCSFGFTVSAYRELFQLLSRCNSPQWYADYPKALPTYLVAGDSDPVGGNGKGPAEVYAGLQKAGVSDVTLRLWKGGRHEMHNEAEKQQVFSELDAWIESKMEPT